MLPELLAQMPPDEATASVSADGAYDTKDCHAAIAQRGAQAVIPPRKNGKPCKTTLVGAGVRNEALKACHRLGHAIWKQWSGYHRTSLGGRPRCMASSVWASGSWHARSSVRWWRCMCVWRCSTASRSSGARPRFLWSPWHSCVWGWGHIVSLSTCATKPFGRWSEVWRSRAPNRSVFSLGQHAVFGCSQPVTAWPERLWSHSCSTHETG
jgi:hypothetical protein